MTKSRALRAVESFTRMPKVLVDRNRQPPPWWSDARLGIFIHWGLYSVPAFAPRKTGEELLASGIVDVQSESPYAEWYGNSMRFPESSVGRYHREHFGHAPYAAFREPFEQGLDSWDPEAWAASFAATGAGYVVMVTKHHDGYCLWPTEVENPNVPGWHCERDLVGELAGAVRAAGMRFGIYYSGGYDWTFNDAPMGRLLDSVTAVPFGDYPAYAAAHIRELIDRYEPSVLWNDICWPARSKEIFPLFEHYFDVVPEGCVNDRWLPAFDATTLLKIPGLRPGLEKLVRSQGAKRGIVPPPVPFSQFRTPEYADLPNGMEGPWEMTRGLDLSFAYNRNSTDDDYLTRTELIGSLADTMAKGGNFLVNIGPRGDDAAIPDEQLTRLGWMAEQNATQPWRDIERTRDRV